MASKKLGRWKIVRTSDTTLEVKFPAGMMLTGKKKNLDIEDLIDAIERYKVIKEGQSGKSKGGEVTIKCCHGNTAIA